MSVLKATESPRSRRPMFTRRSVFEDRKEQVPTLLEATESLCSLPENCGLPGYWDHTSKNTRKCRLFDKSDDPDGSRSQLGICGFILYQARKVAWRNFDRLSQKRNVGLGELPQIGRKFGKSCI